MDKRPWDEIDPHLLSAVQSGRENYDTSGNWISLVIASAPLGAAVG
ncbi:hypothetical protein O7627_01725 [Solwaraspora sp. WMMD1047]|nr:hypothetical protein [Solwaraspora sp. WMMD1047]MDG4828020.1 hypothetical protein [Solwaraspora sp. WMMD1047]